MADPKSVVEITNNRNVIETRRPMNIENLSHIEVNVLL